MLANKLMIFVCLLSGVGLYAQEGRKKFKEAFKASLLVEMDAAYELKNKELQKTELLIKPEFSYKFSRLSKLFVKGQLYTEQNDNLESGETKEPTVSDLSKRLFIGDRTNLELREFYLKTKVFNAVRLTLGKQQIVWGETDGLKLLDVVNPQNFREFILDNFEDSRIPLWSVKTEFDIKDIGVQIVWIPDNSYHITQDFDAPYFTKNLFRNPPGGIPSVFNTADKPDQFIKDADFGVKLSAFTKGWDITVNYFHYYDDLPVFYSDLIIDESGQASVGINPKFERQDLLGTSFNKVFASTTFRGEMVYIFNQNFSSENPDALRGIETSNQFKSAIGLDYIKGESIVSFQLFSDLITQNISAYNRDEFETNVSLLFSQEMMNDNLKAEVLWVHNSNYGDGYAKPALSYWLNTNTQLFLGGTIFYGARTRLFGQFKDRSRMSIGIKWGI